METGLPFLGRMRENGHLIPLEIGGLNLLVYALEEFFIMRSEVDPKIRTGG
jgi:hypothetical protein